MSVVLRGISRVRLLDVFNEKDHQVVRVASGVDTMRAATLAYALSGALQDLVKQHDALLPSASKTKQRAQGLAAILAERSPGMISDLCAAHLDLDDEEKLPILLETEVSDRLRKVIELALSLIHISEPTRPY